MGTSRGIFGRGGASRDSPGFTAAELAGDQLNRLFHRCLSAYAPVVEDTPMTYNDHHGHVYYANW